MDVQAARDLIKGRWRYWRRLQELSQARVARICGVSRSTVARWDDPSCGRLPDVAQVTLIANAIRVKPDAALLYMIRGIEHA